MEVIVYDYRWAQTLASGQPTTSIPLEPSISLPTPSKAPIGKAIQKTGLFLLVFSVCVGLFAASPFLFKELQYRLQPKQEVDVSASFGQINQEIINKQKLVAQEASQYGVTTDFSIVIPKINAKAKVVPNVHPANKEEYLASLKLGVAHAYGTGFPGGGRNIYLFSHSTDFEYNVENYNAIFYLLKELVPGDNIIVFYAGQKFDYQVTDKQIVEANDTEWLTNDGETEQLILQTCWPPGTSLKRLIVVAKPI